MESNFRNKYSKLKKVSNDLLLNIHLRLLEIFGCQGNKRFAGLATITFWHQYYPDEFICTVEAI